MKNLYGLYFVMIIICPLYFIVEVLKPNTWPSTKVLIAAVQKAILYTRRGMWLERYIELIVHLYDFMVSTYQN